MYYLFVTHTIKGACGTITDDSFMPAEVIQKSADAKILSECTLGYVSYIASV